MPATSAAPDTASASPAPAASHWWQNEDWLAVLAGLPILGALAAGWNPSVWVMMGTLGVFAALFFGPRVLFGAIVVLALAWGSQQIAAISSIKAGAWNMWCLPWPSGWCGAISCPCLDG